MPEAEYSNELSPIEEGKLRKCDSFLRYLCLKLPVVDPTLDISVRIHLLPRAAGPPTNTSYRSVEVVCSRWSRIFVKNLTMFEAQDTMP